MNQYINKYLFDAFFDPKGVGRTEADTKKIKEVISEGYLLKYSVFSVDYDKFVSDLEINDSILSFKDDVSDDTINDEMQVEDGNLEDIDDTSVQDDNELLNDEKSQEFLDVINAFSGTKDVQDYIDSDDDDTISKEEILKFLEEANEFDGDNENLSMSDIMQSIQFIIGHDDKQLEEDIKEEEITEDKIEEPEIQEAPKENGHRGLGGPSVIGNDNVNRTNSISQSPKTLDNMTVDELKTELTSKQTETQNKEKEINEVLNGTDSNVQNLQQKADESYEMFINESKKLDEQLANEVDLAQKNVNSKQTEVNAKEQEIVSSDIEIANIKQELTNATNNVSALESQLSTLNSTSSDEIKNKDFDLSSKKQALEAKISSAKQKEESLKAQLAKAEEKNTQLKQQKENLISGENGLNSLQQILSEKQNQLIQEHPELKELLDKSNESSKAVQEYKTNTTDKLKSELQNSLNEESKIKSLISEKQSKEELKEFNPSMMGFNYTLNGENYDVVNMQDFSSPEEFVQYIKQTGMMNIGQYGTMQCFNYAQAYGEMMLGVSKLDPANGDVAYQATQAKWNDRNFAQVKTQSYQDSLNLMAQQLEQGRPVVLSVCTQKDPRQNHYALVIGMKEGVTNPTSEQDFLIIDTYDGELEQLGTKRLMKTNDRSVWVYDEGYSYDNGDRVHLRTENGELVRV